MEKLVFCQFSDQLLSKGSDSRSYYATAYSNMPGYFLPEHFMEIPTWIPIISGQTNANYEQELHIITDVDDSIAYLANTDADHLLFSVMGANEEHAKELLQKVQTHSIPGGYTNPDKFLGLDHVDYLGDLSELVNHLLIESKKTDYSLFTGLESIPRLRLSSGCKNNCSFCTVPTEFYEEDLDFVLGQVDSFRPLKFELVYLDDKTFGQAFNIEYLMKAKQNILHYNPRFRGFIVQTTPRQAIKTGLDKFQKLGIKYIEMGVETVNDAILKVIKKPFRVKELDFILTEAKRRKIQIIPNLIMGLPEDDYSKTINWIKNNKNIIPCVNINYFSVHFGNKRGNLGIKAKTSSDTDQNSPNKSWLSDEERDKMIQAVKEIQNITLS